MAINVIGATSGAVETLPAGVTEKVGTFECKGITNIGALPAGKYLIQSDSSLNVVRDRFNVLGSVPGGFSYVEIPENAGEIELELTDPSFNVLPNVDYDPVTEEKFFTHPPVNRACNISYSSDGQTIAVCSASDTTYLSTNGGKWFDGVSTDSGGNSQFGHYTNVGIPGNDAWRGGITVDYSTGTLFALRYNTTSSNLYYSTDNAQTWSTFTLNFTADSSYNYPVAATSKGDYSYIALATNSTSQKMAIVKVDFSSGSPSVVSGFHWQNSSVNVFAYNSSEYAQMGAFDARDGNRIWFARYIGNSYRFEYIDFLTSTTGGQGQINVNQENPVHPDNTIISYRSNNSASVWHGWGSRNSYAYEYWYHRIEYRDVDSDTWAIRQFGLIYDLAQSDSYSNVNRISYYNRSNSGNLPSLSGILGKTYSVQHRTQRYLSHYNGDSTTTAAYKVRYALSVDPTGGNSARPLGVVEKVDANTFAESNISTWYLPSGEIQSISMKVVPVPVTIYKV